MRFSFDDLVLGETYDRPELAELWGYKDWHAIGRGVVDGSTNSGILTQQWIGLQRAVHVAFKGQHGLSWRELWLCSAVR